MTDDALVAVGRIAKAHGLKGEVSVEAWTDDPEDRFRPGVTYVTEAASPASGGAAVTAADPGAAGSPAARSTLTVASARMHSGRWLVTFEGVADRTAVETLRGTRLLLPARERPTLEDPDDFYDSDLVGLQARTPTGESLGPVTDVVHSPAGDYLVLDLAGTERLVPFINQMVPVVEVEAGYVVIDAPEGLFDL